jgi:hypothetical protein
MMLEFPTPQEIAREALQALRSEPRETAREHFARLVRLGWIDTQGRVTKLLGGEAEPETDKADALLAEDGNGVK